MSPQRPCVTAQVSVPDNVMRLFETTVGQLPELEGVYLNKDDPVPYTSAPFAKLQIKPRKQVTSAARPPVQYFFSALTFLPHEQVLADGFEHGRGYDWNNNGKKLPPAEWHQKLELVATKDARAPLLLDVRNFYESEVGVAFRYSVTIRYILLDVCNFYESEVGLFAGAQPLDTETYVTICNDL